MEFYGPEGKKGSPQKALVKKSSGSEKLVNGAPALKEWQKPEALYLIKAVVLADKGYIEIEGVEKAED